jgi:PAS domain S-box-containing protein
MMQTGRHLSIRERSRSLGEARQVTRAAAVDDGARPAYSRGGLFPYQRVPAMIHAIDAEGRIECTSDWFLAWSGYTRDEVIGCELVEFLSPASRVLIGQRLRHLVQGRDCGNIPCQLVTKDGALLDVLLSAMADFDVQGKFVQALISYVDVTEKNRVADALAQQRAVLSACFQAVPDAMVLSDREHRIRQVNHATTVLFGYDTDDLLGRSDRVLLADGEDIGQGLAAPGKMQHRVVHCRRMNGGSFPAEISETTIRATDGTVLGHLLVLHDISDRMAREKTLQETTRRNVALVRAIPDQIYRVRRDGVCLEYKRDSTRNLTLCTDGVVGRHLRDTAMPEALKQRFLDEVAQAIESGMRRDFDYALQFADGEHFFDAHVVKSGSDEAICVVRDATEQVQAQRSLRDRTRELERTNVNLERFAGIISHDLQEPLRVVSSYMTLLAEEYGEQLGSDARQYMRFATDGARRMQQMICELLQYARVGRVTPMQRAVDLDRVLANVMLQMHLGITGSGAVIHRGPLPMVRGNESLLAQVFSNLISNAIKFAGARAPEIHIAAERSGACWQIAVRDHGIGFDPAFREQIFEVFRRLHTADEYPGTGIGLAIVERIIEGHGGVIWADSAPGQGATFVFTLLPWEGETG